MTATVLRLPAVKDRTGLSRSSIYAAIKAGNFPRQINIGERSVGWLESEISQWVCDRAGKRAAHNHRGEKS